MVHTFLRNLYLRISKVDVIIRIGVDKILPRNLTIRYIFALIAVAALAISGQLIIQTSLSHQTQDQRRIRLLENQIHDSENLRKAALSLQMSSLKAQIKIQIELIESLVSKIQNNSERLSVHGVINGGDFHSPDELIVVLQKVQSSLNGVGESSSLLSTAAISKPDSQLSIVTLQLVNYELAYRSGLSEISKYYEQRLERQIVEFKRIELFLLFTTLFVLAIEALYVFRPGVESLYDALRIRSDFLGRMGHEMRNPMNSILGMTNLLFETQVNDQQKKYLSILKKSSTGLLEVLNNLLDFSSIESGTVRIEKISFDFYKLLERSIDLSVYGAHANGIELVLDLGINVPLHLNGDPVKIQQVLTNLLGNAVKFTKHGEVVLRVQVQKRSEELWIQFAVIDTGMGIEKDKITRIFDAFVQEDSTVRRRFGGTGLGLSISKDLVSLLRGTLAVESQKNIGSRFHFTIPFPVTNGVTVENRIQQLDLRAYEALIIEPNESIGEVIENLISKSGGKTFRIRNHKELSGVFSQMIQSSERKEVIIIDYDFCKEELYIAFSRIRRGTLKPDSLVFLIKTTTSSADIEKLAEHGIRNFIFKPVKPFQLLDSIHQGLHGHSSETGLVSLEGQRDSGIQEIDLVHDQRALRVLAVDDSKDNQFLVKAYLASLPYRLTFADNGQIAVEKFKAAQFDIILMDLQMPEMDGYTALQTIREWEIAEKLSATPAIAISAHDNESGSERFRKAKFSSYLVKPISPQQLRQSILDFTRHIRASNLKETRGDPPAQGDAIAELERQLADLAPQYLENRREELYDLNRLLKEENFERIQTLGHRLRGNAKSYGFEELGKIGAKLELSAKNRDTDKISAAIQETTNYLDQLDYPV